MFIVERVSQTCLAKMIPEEMILKLPTSYGGRVPKPKPKPFPEIEGSESVQDFVAKYKRACLSRKAVHKEVQDKVIAEKPSTGKILSCKNKCPWHSEFLCSMTPLKILVCIHINFCVCGCVYN